jgi:hypothetical protein
LHDLAVGISDTLNDWWQLSWPDVHFGAAGPALLLFGALLSLAVLSLLARRGSMRGRVALPALLPVIRGSHWAWTRHLPFLLFLLGLPPFALALADPYTSLPLEEKAYSGRRIALLIDGSSSMTTQFETTDLLAREGRVFYTALAAAERFVRMRMDGPYHDLIGVIEFGNQAYVITPFTTDYESVLTSLRLVGEPRNWGRFDDTGTTILRGIDQAQDLFRAFNFLEASGNTTVLFSDGRDDETVVGAERLDDLVAKARRYRIPIYMVRMAAGMKFGGVKEDRSWKAAMESTGGRFYAVSDEPTLNNALREIDQLAAGTVRVKEYTLRRPQFAGYTLLATIFWLTATAIKLSLRSFRTFP